MLMEVPVKKYGRWYLGFRQDRNLQQKEFEPLKKYLASSPASEQQKLYQLSLKVADLFDQYLVYRPEWIAAWEENNDEKILAQINQQKQGGRR